MKQREQTGITRNHKDTKTRSEACFSWCLCAFVVKDVHWFRTFLQDSAGYTLVETLVASAILLSVLVPASLFLGRLVMSPYTHDVLLATQLAQEEMERTLAGVLYEDDERELMLGAKRWRVVREVDELAGLIEIEVRVYRKAEEAPLMALKTLRTY